MFILFLFTFIYAYGDIFHHNNIISGDRAMGLGGAYCALSDDASGVVFNPAGLAFANANSISASANAYALKQVTYSKTLGDTPFLELSQGILPSFMGILQKFPTLKDWVFGFALYPIDFEQKDQNDVISLPKLGIEGFHRTVSQTTSHLVLGFSGATRIKPTLAIGLSLKASLLDEIRQEYQDSTIAIKNVPLKSQTDPVTLFRVTTFNEKRNTKALLFWPEFGLQWALGQNWSLGMLGNYPIVITDSLNISSDTSSFLHTTDYRSLNSNDFDLSQLDTTKSLGKFLKSNGGVVYRQTPTQYSPTYKNLGAQKIEPLLGGWPWTLRLGIAWFPNSKWLTTYDLGCYGSPLTPSPYVELLRETVLNHHLGVEYFMIPSIPIRLGFFTNFDARPAFPAQSANYPQIERIDYLGFSLFSGWVQTRSQINVGTLFQYGQGKAQKIRDTLSYQDVTALHLTFAFSTTHTF